MTDTTIPTVVVVSPLDNDVISTSSFTISGTAADDTLVSSVKVKVDGGAYANATGTTSWSKLISGLAEGAHTILVKSVDSSLNESTVTQIDIVIDTLGIDVSITSPRNRCDYDVTLPFDLEINGAAYTESPNTIDTVEVKVGNGSYVEVTPIYNPITKVVDFAKWTTVVTIPSTSNVTITARVTDDEGKTDTATIDFTQATKMRVSNTYN